MWSKQSLKASGKKKGDRETGREREGRGGRERRGAGVVGGDEQHEARAEDPVGKTSHQTPPAAFLRGHASGCPDPRTPPRGCVSSRGRGPSRTHEWQLSEDSPSSSMAPPSSLHSLKRFSKKSAPLSLISSFLSSDLSRLECRIHPTIFKNPLLLQNL